MLSLSYQFIESNRNECGTANVHSQIQHPCYHGTLTKDTSTLTSPPATTRRVSRKLRKRVARACILCHTRKVRCNRREQYPCDACNKADIECRSPESFRRRRLRVVVDNDLNTSFESVTQELVASKVLETAESHGLMPANEANIIENHFALKCNYHSPESACDISADHPRYFTSTSHITSQSSLCINYLDSKPKYSLPTFLHPLPSTLSTDDIEFLVVKRALEIPSPSLREPLLRAYIDYVHPYLPILDLHEFLATINDPYGINNRMSLLLYMAVMFSATFFVEVEHVSKAGYSTRRAMSQDFFNRARILYDFDCESDELVLVQALLLMSYWYESPDSQRDGWYWLGLAISTLEGIASTDMVRRYTNQKRLKRVWWSCYMQDRLIALCTRRPTRINDVDFHVDMLEESDFEILRLENDCTMPLKDSTLMQDVEVQKQVAAMSISMAKLCIFLGHVLEVRYSSVTPLENGSQSVTMLHPKGSHHVKHTDVEAVEEELMSWVACLPLCCHYTSPQVSLSTNESSAMIVRRMFLHILFYTALAALHRAFPSHSQSPSKTYYAATQISLIVRDLQQQHLERLLPSTAVTSILTASMVCLTDSGDWFGQPQAFDILRTNLDVLEELQKAYIAADHAIMISRAAIDRVGISNR